MNNDAYEQGREDNGVREDPYAWENMSEGERFADSHGYSRGRCAVHGTFWTDSGDGCPSCTPEPEEDGQTEQDQLDMDMDRYAATHDEVILDLMLQSWEHRLLRAARETTQGSFLMSALRRNGVL